MEFRRTDTSMDVFELRRSIYSLDPEQQALRDAFRSFFEKECPTSVVRASEPVGHDARLWRKVLDMGVATMSLRPDHGGDGATLVDLVLVAEEFGRALAPVPLISHIAATRALERADADELATAEAGPIWALAIAPASTGRRQLVPDGAVAERVLALRDGNLEFHKVENLPHVRSHGSTPLAWWTAGADAAPARLASGETARELHGQAVAEWRLLMAAALVGMTDAALSIAVEFAKTRETMGVPIGALQGISFQLADVAISVTGARNLTRRAAWMTEHEPGARPDLIPMAYAFAVETATLGTKTAAHVQGGLGFTTEADASLYFLRSKGWGVLGGSRDEALVDIGRAVSAALR